MTISNEYQDAAGYGSIRSRSTSMGPLLMNKAKQKMLEKKGWKVGTAEEFLRLSPVESRYIDLKFALSRSGSGHTLGTHGHENESE